MADEVDKVYAVIITATARKAILAQARYIAVEQRSPQNAAEWLDRVWTRVDSLQFLPLRNVQAEGYEHLSYVVRRLILDNHLILYSVNEVTAVVYVIGLRHGAKLPRRRDLPSNPHE